MCVNVCVGVRKVSWFMSYKLLLLVFCFLLPCFALDASSEMVKKLKHY